MYHWVLMLTFFITSSGAETLLYSRKRWKWILNSHFVNGCEGLKGLDEIKIESLCKETKAQFNLTYIIITELLQFTLSPTAITDEDDNTDDDYDVLMINTMVV